MGRQRRGVPALAALALEGVASGIQAAWAVGLSACAIPLAQTRGHDACAAEVA